MNKPKITQIGDIGNRYGVLLVREYLGQCDMGIHCCDGTVRWEPISDELYDEMIKHRATDGYEGEIVSSFEDGVYVYSEVG